MNIKYKVDYKFITKLHKIQVYVIFICILFIICINLNHLSIDYIVTIFIYEKNTISYIILYMTKIVKKLLFLYYMEHYRLKNELIILLMIEIKIKFIMNKIRKKIENSIFDHLYTYILYFKIEIEFS